MKKQALSTTAKWAVGGAVVTGTATAAARYLENDRIRRSGTKTEKRYLKKHPKITHPLFAGTVGAVTGALRFALTGAEDQRRQARNSWDSRRQYESRQQSSNGYRSTNREAEPAKPPSYAEPPSWLHGVKTKVEAKNRHRAEAMKHHPDRGGDLEKMKQINVDWDTFKKHHFDKLSFVLPFFLDELRQIRAAPR